MIGLAKMELNSLVMLRGSTVVTCEGGREESEEERVKTRGGRGREGEKTKGEGKGGR